MGITIKPRKGSMKQVFRDNPVREAGFKDDERWRYFMKRRQELEEKHIKEDSALRKKLKAQGKDMGEYRKKNPYKSFEQKYGSEKMYSRADGGYLQRNDGGMAMRSRNKVTRMF